MYHNMCHWSKHDIITDDIVIVLK